MAIALVGTIGAATLGGGNSPVTPAYGSGENRTAGNKLVLWVAGLATATLPTTPAGWSVLVQKAQGTACSSTIFVADAAGADAAPTVVAATGTAWACQLAEFSGVRSGATPDRSATNGAATSPVVATSAGVNAATGELILTCCAARVATTTVTSSQTLNNGTLNTSSNDATSVANHYNFGWVLGTANAAADSDSFACSTTITGMSVAMASLGVPVVVTRTTALALTGVGS